MILKTFELKKIKLDNYRFFLVYGINKGLIEDIVENNLKPILAKNILNYEENEILQNEDNFKEEILNKSFFENEKLIIINRVSDKILEIVEDIKERNIEDIKIIFKSGVLDSKSKIRKFFEKNNDLIVIPFYEDNSNSLFTILVKLLKEKNIKLSRESINLLVDRASGDRENLLKELDKIYSYSLTNKNVDFKTVEKLSNLAENYGIDQLVESYLSRNKRKLSKILNENNFSDEDCMLMLRVILNKSKRLLGIIKKNSLNRSIEEVMASTKPPIFWKEKESIKKQVKIWKEEDLKNKIYQINEIELLIKNNFKNSLNIISDFILN